MGARLPKLSRVARIGAIRPGEPAKTLGSEELGEPRRGVELLDVLPQQLREVARRIGRRRAQAIWRLLRKGVIGTVPELCVYDWLKSRPVQFEFQSSQLGGRMVAGGAIVDFLIYGLSADGLYVWRVQGEHWHQGGAVERKDQVQRDRLLHVRIGGLPIVAVVDLWESDIYDRYPEVFRRAEVGEGLRG